MEFGFKGQSPEAFSYLCVELLEVLVSLLNLIHTALQISVKLPPLCIQTTHHLLQTAFLLCRKEEMGSFGVTTTKERKTGLSTRIKQFNLGRISCSVCWLLFVYICRYIFQNIQSQITVRH